MTFINERTYTPVDAPVSVAFLGLGVMGYPMAGHLAKAGHHVSVYNRTEAKAKSYDGKYKTATATVSTLREGIWKVYNKIGCNTPANAELLGGDGCGRAGEHEGGSGPDDDIGHASGG